MSVSSEYRIIRPANRLHIKARFSDLSVAQMMARAHRVMDKLAKDYTQWLRVDVEALLAARQKLCADPRDALGRADLFRIAHDIRGQAASFGYDLASEIATSLCQYLERRTRLESVDLEIIEAHIDAIRAYMGQPSKGDGGALGQEVMAELTASIQRTEGP